MCFTRHHRTRPENASSYEKMNRFFTDYISLITTFFADNTVAAAEQIQYTRELKVRLDAIKANMQAHANRHTVEYNETTIDTYMTCLNIVEIQFNAMLLYLHDHNKLEIDAQLKKLKSIKDLFEIT